MEYTVTTFYAFQPLQAERLKAVKHELEDQASELGIQGLVLLATEGVNATIAGSEEAVQHYKDFLRGLFGELTFKDSKSEGRPFRRFKVKIKPEIVQLKRTDIQPTGHEAHVSPAEWDALIADEETVVIDVRNWYETKLGTFKRAIDPQTWQFSQFPEWVKKSGIPKDKKIGIYCTGGIRCEKAAVAMHELGYSEVYQLDGGILNYIEERPHQNFEGDCFVFDHRLAVGQDLRPSEQFSRCWHCGNGGSLDNTCAVCGNEFRLCDDCTADLPTPVCSKNCHYHVQRQAA